MKLLPRNPEKMFNTVQALIAPGQTAYLVGYPLPDTIRIQTSGVLRGAHGKELTRPEQLEHKEYKIIA